MFLCEEIFSQFFFFNPSLIESFDSHWTNYLACVIFYIFFHYILLIEGLNVTWLKVFLTHIVFYLGVRAGCLVYCGWNNQGKIIVLSKGSLGFLGWGPGYGGPAKWESFESLGLGRCRLLLASVLLIILFRISDSSLRSWSSDGNSRLLFLDFL